MSPLFCVAFPDNPTLAEKKKCICSQSESLTSNQLAERVYLDYDYYVVERKSFDLFINDACIVVKATL